MLLVQLPKSMTLVFLQIVKHWILLILLVIIFRSYKQLPPESLKKRFPSAFSAPLAITTKNIVMFILQ